MNNTMIRPMVHLDFGLHPHPLLFPDLSEYNCSNRTPEEWEQMKDPSLFCGAILLFFGVVSLSVYSIVISAMTSKSVLSNDCIKLMYLYCWIDSGNVVFGGFITAVLFFTGEVFCTSNFWAFAPGALGLGCWSASCILCLSLALNRCFAFHKIEMGKWVYVVMGLTCCHFTFMAFFTRPPVFNATKRSWFIQPSIRSIEEEAPLFQNSYHLTENVITATVTPMLYAYVCLKMWFKRSDVNDQASKSYRKMQLSVFIQSLIICFLTCVTSVIFAYMQIFAHPKWLPFLAEVAYEVCGTLPAAIILILNPTIKRRAKTIFCPRLSKTSYLTAGTNVPSRSNNGPISSRRTNILSIWRSNTTYPVTQNPSAASANE